MVRTAHPPELDSDNQRAMDKLIPVHHSLVDWEFQAGVGWAIANDRFVSAPSALRRPTTAGQGEFGYLALKVALSGNLRDGRVITYRLHESTIGDNIYIFVRAQTSPHLGLPANCYFFMMTRSGISIYRRVASASATIASAGWAPDIPINTWVNIRCTWYTWLGADLAPILRFLFDRQEAGIWVNKLTFDEANPQWQASLTNLFGMGARAWDAGSQFWIDDTIVYRPA